MELIWNKLTEPEEQNDNNGTEQLILWLNDVLDLHFSMENNKIKPIKNKSK